MNITESKTANIVTLSLSGRLDTTTAKAFEDRILAHIDSGERRIVIDLTGLEYISSAGLRAIIVAAKLLQTAGAEMMLCESRDQVRQVLALSFRSLLRNYESEAEALAAFSR